jgi:pantoate--beta-alanine ligase
MKIADTISNTRLLIDAARKDGKTIGLVPTMGALHIGHISLIETAKQMTGFVAVSIFVNPTQFGPSEDFGNYPRPFEEDAKICKELGVDLIFAPSVEQMYPSQNTTWVNVEQITNSLCGRSRPGHFRGVATVCTKLFNIVRPDIAFFGQKDAQQVVVIKRMVSDLNMPLKIQVCPIVREEDGLAVSSRNKYLTSTERKDAPLLYESLQKAEQLIKAGVKDSEKIIAEMQKIVAQSKLLQPEYIEVVNPETLQSEDEIIGPVLIAVAARLGSARLIDNILVDNKAG